LNSIEEKIKKIIEKYESQILKYESTSRENQNDVVEGLKMGHEEALTDFKNLLAYIDTQK
jgi:predicted component of type VI protein secretion system